MIRVGRIEALFRYPVKSMTGEALDAASVGWHGLDGDRRLALRRLDERGGFPWLTAGKLPALIHFAPIRRGDSDAGLPTHIRTPEGQELEVFGPELAEEIGRRYGAPVEMMHLSRGIFDEANMSVISAATVAEVGRLSTQPADVRRFRPNVLIATERALPFEEEEWVGGVLTFGEGGEGVAVGVTLRDERCSMVNLDPDSERSNPDVLKAIMRARDNNAGVYGTVTRRGRLAVGQPVFFEPAAPA